MLGVICEASHVILIYLFSKGRNKKKWIKIKNYIKSKRYLREEQPYKFRLVTTLHTKSYYAKNNSQN